MWVIIPIKPIAINDRMRGQRAEAYLCHKTTR